MGQLGELDVDRRRVLFPRTHKILIQIFPVHWDRILADIEAAVSRGTPAVSIYKSIPALRGLPHDVRRPLISCIAGDRREIVRKQQSFLTKLYEVTLDQLLGEASFADDSVAVEKLIDDGKILAKVEAFRRCKPFVFISHHSNSSRRCAEAVAEGLERHGVSCWVAPRNIPKGKKWNKYVYEAAQRCAAIVVLLNDEAMQSDKVHGEVQVALRRAITPFVVRTGNLDPASVDIGLAAYQYFEWDEVGRTNYGALVSLLKSPVQEAIASFG